MTQTVFGPVPALDAGADAPAGAVLALAVGSSDPGDSGAPYLVARSHALLAGAVVAVALIVLGEPLGLAPLALALALMAAAGVAPPADARRWGLIASLPTGFVVVLAWGLLWGLAGGAAGVPVWESRAGALGGVLAFSMVAGLLSRHRAGHVLVVGKDASAAVGFLVLMSFFAWVIATQPLAWWSRVNSTGTDFLRHLRLIRLVRGDGWLIPGEVTYPRALHAFGAWLTTALGLPADAGTLWRAMAPVAFLMLGIMLLAIMVVSSRLTDALVGRSRFGTVGAVLAAAAFVQTAWFDTFLAFGSVMNMVAALSLLTILLAGLQAGSYSARATPIVSAVAVAVAANSYQLVLPAAALGAAPWVVQFMRRGARSGAVWLVWVISGLLALHGSGIRPAGGGHTAAGVAATTSTPTVVGLFRPDWWWWAALTLSVSIAWLMSRHERGAWALSYLGMALASIASVALLMRASGSSWDLLRYYPAKTLWTEMVVVIPVAAAAVPVLVALVWRGTRGFSPMLRSLLRGSVVLGLGVLLTGVLGRGSAFPPHLGTIAQGRAGAPNWSLALLESLDARRVPGGPDAAAIVFGLVPSADISDVVLGYVGGVDSMATEALDHVGWPGAFTSPIKHALATRNMGGVCRYLSQNPEALRITGPNPQAGPQWIIDSGCPADVVAPESWISLNFDPRWFERTAWDGGKWTFPSYDEIREADPRMG